MSSVGLYVHIPFCAQKCPYCDFYSGSYRRSMAEAYLAALCADIQSHAGRGILADTLYFGGGTPSLFAPEWIGEIISAAREAFSLRGEITLEANPNTLSPERIQGYLAAGINRFSIGVQSFQDAELRSLGRRHTAAGAAAAVRMAAGCGAENLSLDLMLGTPGQTRDSLRRTLAQAISLPVQHISAYLLKVEPGTPYWNSPLLQTCMDEEEQAQAYEEMVSLLQGAGFEQYEISNFARPGFFSRHNLKYWRCEEYLGFGASAHSYYGGKRYANPPSIDRYLACGPRSAEVLEENPDRAEEYIMLGLRLTEGISLQRLKRLGVDTDEFLRCAKKYLGAGYAGQHGDQFFLTPKGFLLSNHILAELIG